jgi:hypothetical protein
VAVGKAAAAPSHPRRAGPLTWANGTQDGPGPEGATFPVMAFADHPPEGSLAFVDDDGNRVLLDAAEAVLLFGLTDGLEAATVSACPTCRSRVLAVVAVLDVLESGPYHPRATDLAELAEEAPTLHLYVEDLVSECEHDEWLDPGFTEWCDAIEEVPGVRRPAP